MPVSKNFVVTDGAEEAPIFRLADLLEAHRLKEEHRGRSVQNVSEPQSILSMIGQTTGSPTAKLPVPSTTTLLIADKNLALDERHAVGNTLFLLTFAYAYAMQLVYFDHGNKPYDITNPTEAGKFCVASANKLHAVMTRSLTGYLATPSQTAFSYDRTVKGSELHLAFLNEMFKGFDLPDASKAILDSTLTAVNQKLTRALQDERLDLTHCINIMYFEPVPGLDLKLPHVRLLFLTIDKRAWEERKKKKTTDKIRFTMSYIDESWTVNSSQIDQHKLQLDKLLQDITGAAVADVQRQVQITATVTPK